MKPTHVLLVMLAALCEKLAKSQRVEPAMASEARKLYKEWNALVLRHSTPPSTPALNDQMESQAKDLGIHMVDLIEKYMAV